MNVEIINTGSELLIGQVLNTHQQWLARRFAAMGWPIGRQATVTDTRDEINRAVREALSRADVVLTTGGLGPTADDLTREGLAEMLNRPLHEDAAVVRHIADYFRRRARPQPPGTRVQAMVPEGARVLSNAFGTAPGLWMELDPNPFGAHPACLVLLPGPPRELHPMFDDQVTPLLTERFGKPRPPALRILRSSGIGESQLEARLGDILPPNLKDGLEIGYCSRPGEVDLRLGAQGDGAQQQLDEAERAVLGCLGRYFFGRDEISLVETVVDELRRQKKTVAVAESCTGGYLSNQITHVPGASEVFLGGCVTYSNAAKQKVLGVSGDVLRRCGAVSAETACRMAEGVRLLHGADYGLATTGIAGPGGGSDEKPVGTVYLALATSTSVKSMLKRNGFDRLTFKKVTSQQALAWLRLRMAHSRSRG